MSRPCGDGKSPVPYEVVRLSRYGVAAFATFGLVIVACSGSYLGSTQDAGSPVPADANAPPADVTSFVPTSDSAPPPSDAGSDATVDTGPPSPCLRANLFCDDFDDGDGSIGAKWSSVQTAAGPFDLDESMPITRPRALRLQMTAGGGNRSSSLTKTIDVSGDVKISLDARVDLPSSGSFVEMDPLIIGVSPPSAGVNYQVFGIAIYPDSVQFEAYRSFTDGGSAVSTERIDAGDGAYHRITVTLRSAGGTTNATLEVDGVVASTRSLATETPRTLSLQVGAPYTNNANFTPTIRVDNVIVERL